MRVSLSASVPRPYICFKRAERRSLSPPSQTHGMGGSGVTAGNPFMVRTGGPPQAPPPMSRLSSLGCILFFKASCKVFVQVSLAGPLAFCEDHDKVPLRGTIFECVSNFNPTRHLACPKANTQRGRKANPLMVETTSQVSSTAIETMGRKNPLTWVIVLGSMLVTREYPGLLGGFNSIWRVQPLKNKSPRPLLKEWPKGAQFG